jgi:uncharacterized protein (DUF1015 family)
MAQIQPFRALRYDPKKVGDLARVTAPPYDILSPADQDRYYVLHSNNVVKLDFGKEMAGDDGSRNKYGRAATLLGLWTRDGILKKDLKPGFYVAAQDYADPDGKKRRFLGLICLLKLEAYDKKVVLPHERTLSKPKADRLELTRATEANLSQIFFLFDDQKSQGLKWLEARAKKKPAGDFKTGDGVRHRLWPVFEKAPIQVLKKMIVSRPLYIADGHHRYETMLTFRKECARKSKLKAPASYTLACLAPMQSPGLTVLPTHRMVFGLSRFHPQALPASLKTRFDLEPRPNLEALLPDLQKAGRKGAAFGLCLATGFYLLKLKPGQDLDLLVPGDRSAACKRLDVTLLQVLVLEGLLGMTPESIAAQQNLRFTKSAREAAQSVASGSSQAAFLLNPTPIESVRDVSDAGDVMPQKSTYFLPKLLTGLVMRKIE